MKFRLLQGAHVQANPDGLDSASLKTLRASAVEKGLSKDDLETATKEGLLHFLRRDQYEQYPDGMLPTGGMLRPDGSIHYHASLTNKPVFEESNPHAIAVIVQDTNKYQRADATPEQMVGMTDTDLLAELKRRGIATPDATVADLARGGQPVGTSGLPTRPQQLMDERFNNLESLTVADLRKVADDNEIDLTDNHNRPLTRKEDIINAIRASQEVGA